MKKPTKFEEWFRTFLDEKDLETVEFMTTIGNDIHVYDNYDVAEWIINNMSPADQAKVKEKIVYIDFKNGDVNHFLEYIGKGFAEVLSKEEEGK